MDDLAKYINVMLSFRAFKRALTAPLLFQFEIVLAIFAWSTMKEEPDFFNEVFVHKYGILGLLVFSHFVISRSRVLLNKLVYVVVSLATAFKNKKQRIRSQWVCFVL